jgi:DNA polymerase-3 subunit gamma/tau
MAESAPASAGPPADAGEWRELIAGLRLGGVTRQLANNCVFEALEGERIRLKIDPAHANLNTEMTRERLEQALAARFGDQIKLDLTVADGDAKAQTPAQLEAIDRSRKQERAEQAIAEDPLVKAFESEFDARVVKDSIRPRDGLQ